MLPVRPTSSRLGLLLSAALLAPTLASAKQAAQRPAILDDRVFERSVIAGRQRIDEDGVPRALYAVNYAVAPGAPEAMARQYLSENHDTLRLADEELADLAVRFVRRGRAVTTVRFEQTYQGIPVLAPDVAVSIDGSNRVVYVANGYEPEIALASIVPAVTQADARGAALARLDVEGELNHDTQRLVVVPGADRARLAWQVSLVPSVSPIGDWEVLVDAATGEIFRVLDHSCHANGSGFTFDPDPLATAQATYGQTGYTDGNDAATTQLNAARTSVTLNDITDLGGGVWKLQGPYAQVVDSESPFKGLFTQASTTFNFDRAADNFEAVNCYYHIDHVMRHINQNLGITLMPLEYAGGVRYDPSGFNGADNSHYIPSTGNLAFGEGGVDDAEDADVVIHELGHGLHDWVTGNQLSSSEGLSEGSGDYVAMSYSRSLGQWPIGNPAYHWVFGWDGHNPFWPGRITNYNAHYPEGLTGAIHTDGQIWSSCMMKIWDDVGRDNTDAAFLEGLGMTNSGANQNDAAAAVLQAALSLGLSASDIGSFATHMQNTGYDVSVGLEYTSHSLTDECSNPDNVNGVLEPGENAHIPVLVTAESIPLTNATGVLTTSTPGVTIVDGVATWPTLNPGVPTSTNAPHFAVQLDPSIPCGTDIEFEVAITADQGGPYPVSFIQEVGQPLTPPGLPKAIPDNVPAGPTSVLAVGTAEILTDLNVRVEITHPRVGDVFIKLRSPAGTEVVLLDRPGFPATSFGCNNDNMNVTFDDASGFFLENHCAGTIPWYAGTAHAVGNLSAFHGQSTLGNWTLTVSDNAGAATGSIVSWELITTPPVTGQCTPCQTGTDAPVISSVGRAFDLSQNRPNPFGAGTEIRFQVPREAHTTLAVFDVAGRLVRTLVDRDLAAGSHTVAWDGTDRERNKVSSGIYFYRLTSGADSAMRRMQIVR